MFTDVFDTISADVHEIENEARDATAGIENHSDGLCNRR